MAAARASSLASSSVQSPTDFAGGEQDRGAPVAVGDKAEEQASLVAGHRPETRFVQGQQGGAEYLRRRSRAGGSGRGP